MQSPHPSRRRPVLRTLTICTLAVIGAVWLWVDHRNHVMSWLPVLLVLACPILHFFGHGSHRHGTASPEARDP